MTALIYPLQRLYGFSVFFSVSRIRTLCLLPALSRVSLLLCRRSQQHQTQVSMTWPPPRLRLNLHGALLSRLHHRVWNKTETWQSWKGGGQMAAGVRPGAARWRLKGSPRMQSCAPPTPFWSNITQIFLLFFLHPTNPADAPPTSSSNATLLRNARICR